MMKGVSCFVYVKNTAMNQIVSMDKENFSNFHEARELKRKLEREYGQVGCHDVRILIELWPNEEEEDNLEEEFDADEMEEE